MSVALIGFCTGVLAFVMLLMLFRHEDIRGARYGEHIRAQADLLVLKWAHWTHKTIRYIARDFVKQLSHYTFHTLLKAVLALVTRIEKGLRNMMRVNKTLAKSADRESTTRTKLEELAVHKAENALTEREKKFHRDRSLNGF